jgi:hypothetical protein
MITLHYGPNSYRRVHQVQAALQAHQTVRRCDVTNPEELEQLYEYISWSDLFAQGGGKVALCWGLKEVADKERIQQLLERAASDANIALHINEDWSKKTFTKEIKALLKGIKMEACFYGASSEQEDVAYLLSQAQQRNIVTDKRAVEMVYRQYQDMWAVHHELERIYLCEGNATHATVSAHIHKEKEVSLFQFSRAVCAPHSSLKEKTYMWEYILAQRIDMFGVMGYLGKVGASAKMAKALSQADIKIKSGLLEPEQAMLEVVLK